MKIKLQVDPHSEEVTGTVFFDDTTSQSYGPKPISDVLAILKAKNKFESGILPPAVRYLSTDRNVVVFERPPMQQLVEFIPAKRDIAASYVKQKKSYLLNIPWTVYVVCLGDYRPTLIRCYVRNSALTGLNDPVYLMPLLNFYNSSTLCNPIFEKYEGEIESLAEGINVAYNMVWNSGWNYDLLDGLQTSQKNGMPWKIPGRTSLENINLIVKWHEKWASLSMEEVLKMNWMTPGTHKNEIGVAGTQFSLAYAIDYAGKEQNTAGETNPVNKFLVDLAGAIV